MDHAAPSVGHQVPSVWEHGRLSWAKLLSSETTAPPLFPRSLRHRVRRAASRGLRAAKGALDRFEAAQGAEGTSMRREVAVWHGGVKSMVKSLFFPKGTLLWMLFLYDLLWAYFLK